MFDGAIICELQCMGEAGDVDIHMEAGSENLLQSVEICFLHIDNIRLKVLKLARTGCKEDFFDEEGFLEVVDMLDDLVCIVSYIYKKFKKDYSSEKVCVKTIQSLEVHLLFVLKALFTAKYKKDFFMLVDLLEHELMENIIQWKIKVVPELKKIKEIVNIENV